MYKNSYRAQASECNKSDDKERTARLQQAHECLAHVQGLARRLPINQFRYGSHNNNYVAIIKKASRESSHIKDSRIKDRNDVYASRITLASSRLCSLMPNAGISRVLKLEHVRAKVRVIIVYRVARALISHRAVSCKIP
jgi:hypothetical protein